MRDDERWRPGTHLIARNSPEFLAGILVERHHVRTLFLVELQIEPISIEYGSRPFSKLKAHAHRREIFFSDQPSIKIVAVKPARAEEREDVFAISDRAVRCEAAITAVVALMGSLSRRDPLPD